MRDKLLIFKDKNYDFERTLDIVLAASLFSAIFGFIYETIFYWIDLGYFVKRGSTFGPWIPIYFFGGFLIIYLTYRFKDKPLKVFLLNCLITGLLELASGFVLDKFFHLRLWDYNTEKWNFGNIGGYVCFRSVLLFGLGSLLLIYVVIPLIMKLVEKFPKKVVNAIVFILSISFFADMILHLIIK